VELKRADIGVHIKGKWLGGIFFCDDIALLAKDHHTLQRMLDTVTQYCVKWHIHVGHEKTQIMVCATPFNAQLPVWPVNGFTLGLKKVQACNKYKHLGKWVQDDGSNQIHTGQVIRSYRYRLRQMKRTAEYLGGIPVLRAREMLLAKLMPLREYVAGVVQLNAQQQNQANGIWRDAVRWATSMPRNVSVVPLMADMRLPVPKYRDAQYVMHLYKHMHTKQCNGEDRPILWVYKARLEQLEHSQRWQRELTTQMQNIDAMKPSTRRLLGLATERARVNREIKKLRQYNADTEQWWPLQVKQACSLLELQRYWNHPEEMREIQQQQWHGIVASAVEEKSRCWYVQELNKYGHNQLAQKISELSVSTNKMASYLLNKHRPSRMVMSMLRSRSLPTQSCRHNVRYKRIWTHTEECWVCDTEQKETAIHVMLECPNERYQQCRRRAGLPGIVNPAELDLFGNYTQKMAEKLSRMIWNIWVIRWWMLTGEALGKYNVRGGFDREEILQENGIAQRGTAFKHRDVNEYLLALTPLGSTQTGNDSGSVNSQAEISISSYVCRR